MLFSHALVLLELGPSFLLPSSPLIQTSIFGAPATLLCQWICGNNQLKIPCGFPPIAVALPGPGWLLPLLGILRGLQDHCNCLPEPDLAEPSKLLPQKGSLTQQPQTTTGGRCFHLSSTAGRMAGRQTSMQRQPEFAQPGCLSPVCGVALSRAVNT